MTGATTSYQKKYQEIFGLQMAYIEEGQGDPILFLHGNPTSSYIWRNIIPYVQGMGRVIAPDLIGMGDSQKLPVSGPDSYTFVEHRRYLDALLEVLEVRENVTIIGHDWGAALGLDWARRHPESVRGVAFMEGVTEALEWDTMPEAARGRFQALRSPAGEQLVLEKNTFIEGNLPATILRTLSDEEMNEYRRPFLAAGESRRPTLSWARQLPIGGEPAEVLEVIKHFNQWLEQSAQPKLLIEAVPGTKGPNGASSNRAWQNVQTVSVRGHHTPQEDSPAEIGQAIANWLESSSRR